MTSTAAPFFSVIVPSFNRASLLADTIESVLQQQYRDFELLVVDDGSVDSSRDVAASFGDSLRLLTQSNLGPGAARNLGSRHARGRYLAFLDSDDLWFPWSLDVYAQVIRRGNQPAFIAGKPYRFAETNAFTPTGENALTWKAFVDYYASGDEWRWWGVSSFVVKRDAFQDVGGFISKRVNSEDADLALKLGTASGFVQVTSPVTFAYREHAGSLMNDHLATIDGASILLDSETHNLYPGGVERAAERRRILGRHLRPVSLECLRKGMHRKAWQLYLETVRWHTRERRWKYLLGFPAEAVLSSLKGLSAYE